MSVLRLKKHFCIILMLCSVRIFYALVHITCPILYLTGYICPTCGVTRALLALIHLNIQSYLSYQPMALPLAIVVLLAFHLQQMKKPFQTCATVFMVVVLFSNTVLYLHKIT